MLKRLRGDERGAVLVTAVLASAIVLLLSISAVSVAIHNTNESGYDRGRLQAIGAAEAGVDAYYSMLNTTQFTSANLISVTGSSSCVPRIRVDWVGTDTDANCSRFWTQLTIARIVSVMSLRSLIRSTN